MLAQKQKLNSTTILMAKSTDLTGVKTLIIVPGFSSKGLGAAGVSQQEEMERVQALIKAANELKIPIVLIHIGGTARRQGQSDVFNQVVAANAKYMIVVKQADEDKFFTNLTLGGKIPLILVDKIAEVETPLGNLFK
jgi:dihydropteroate synthase